MALFGHVGLSVGCPLIGVDRKLLAGGQSDANDQNRTFGRSQITAGYMILAGVYAGLVLG
jgi:deoxyinosine 3'endonuclease (endonuclease V)